MKKLFIILLCVMSLNAFSGIVNLNVVGGTGGGGGNSTNAVQNVFPTNAILPSVSDYTNLWIPTNYDVGGSAANVTNNALVKLSTSDGSSLTNLTAGQLVGTVPISVLPPLLQPWPQVENSLSENIARDSWWMSYPQYAYAIGQTNGGTLLNPSVDAPTLAFNFYTFRTPVGATTMTFAVQATTASGTSTMGLYLQYGVNTSVVDTNQNFTVTTTPTWYSITWPCTSAVYSAAVWVNGGGVSQGHFLVLSNYIATDVMPPPIRSIVTADTVYCNNSWQKLGYGYYADSLSYIDFVTFATNVWLEVVDHAVANSSVISMPVILNGTLLTNIVSGSNVNTNWVSYHALALPAGQMNHVTVFNSGNSRVAGFGQPVLGMTVRSVFSDQPIYQLQRKAGDRITAAGDSILMGQAATIPALDSLVGNLRVAGFDVTDVAIGWDRLQDHTNNIPALARQLTLNNPRIVLVNYGRNDYGSAGITPAVFQFYYGILVTNLVNKCLVVAQSPIPAAVETANALGATEGDYRMAVSNAAVACPGVIYLDGTNVLSKANLSADGIHPTDMAFGQWTKIMIPLLSTNR